MSLKFGQNQFGGGEVFGGANEPVAPVAAVPSGSVGPLFERILYEILLPGNRPGMMIAKETKVVSMSAGSIDVEHTSNVDSSGPTPKSNRSLIFE